MAAQCAIVGDVYNVAQLSSIASSPIFQDTRTYPYLTRLGVDTEEAVNIILFALEHFYYTEGLGWNKIALLSTTTAITSELAELFIEKIDVNRYNFIEITTFQQFLPLSEFEADFAIEFNEVIRTKARVIIAFIFSDWEEFIDIAAENNLVGENYVWLVGPSVVEYPFAKPNDNTRGALGAIEHIDVDEMIKNLFLDYWVQSDPNIYPYTGPDYPNPPELVYSAFDMILLVAQAITYMDEELHLFDSDDRVIIPAETWTSVLRNITFHGVSGLVEFDKDGNRKGSFDVVNYTPENGWNRIGYFTNDEFYYIGDADDTIIWYSNTTEVPNLDIRDPVKYFSCHDKKTKIDEQGYVNLHTPGSKDVDDIDLTYHCDQFLDCENLSDESVDCNPNALAVHIAFGIITGILIFIALLLLVFVILFGYCLNYHRLRHVSPLFLIIILISVIVGFSSIYAWFGKPSNFSCAVQPWLLGLPAISMISALSVKNFRIWRIFRFPLKRIQISNLEVFIYWVIIMIPAVFIIVLWTIVSTPTASLEDRNDELHYVCTTGGFTKEPGGYIFFAIFAAYSLIILLFGGIVSYLARNAPSVFNETKILTISIYNILLLGSVGITVFLTVSPSNPFVGWILRTMFILYVFGATMFLQFAPILFGVFILDKGKNKLRNLNLQQAYLSKSSSSSGTSA